MCCVRACVRVCVYVTTGDIILGSIIQGELEILLRYEEQRWADAWLQSVKQDRKKRAVEVTFVYSEQRPRGHL